MHGFEHHGGRHGMRRGHHTPPRGGDFERGGGWAKGSGRRAKRFDGEELRLLVLGLLKEEHQHGYQLIRAFTEKSGGAYQPSPGVLYPLLTMLAEMGLIAETGESGSRRCYALTEEGEAELAARRETADGLMARLAALAELAERTDRAPVRRAVHNLRSAVVERLGRENASSDLGFDIARLIDEVTQKIERL